MGARDRRPAAGPGPRARSRRFPVPARRLVDAYALLLALYLVLRALTGDALWPVAAGHWVAAPAWFLALALLPLTLARRRWRTALLLAGPALLLLPVFGGTLLPRATPEGAGPALVAMSYNAGNGRAPPDRLAAALGSSGADLIGLQELTSPQADALARALASVYPYQALYPGGIAGKGLLSRYPIREAAQLHLYPDRPDLRAVLAVDGRALTVIVAHPPPPRLHPGGFYPNRSTAAQVAALTALTAGDGATLLLGDLNLTPLHAGYGDLRRAGLRDAFGEAGRGFGFTLPRRWQGLPLLPFVRVDYVWHTAHLGAARAWLGPDAGSDHLPVCARLHWR